MKRFVLTAGVCSVGLTLGLVYGPSSRAPDLERDPVAIADHPREAPPRDASPQPAPLALVGSDGASHRSHVDDAALPEGEPLTHIDATQVQLEQLRDELKQLREEDVQQLHEISRLVTLNRKLELDIAVSGTGAALDTTLGRWLATLLPEERPTSRIVRLVGEFIAPYEGVNLSREEGLWLVERIVTDDWGNYADGSVDGALILFLGPDRIAMEVKPELLAALREDYAEEGWFR